MWTETAQRCGTKMRLEPDIGTADFRGTTSHHRLFHLKVTQCKTHQIRVADSALVRVPMHTTSSTPSPVDTDDDSSRREAKAHIRPKCQPVGETHVDECHKVEDTNTRLGKEGRATRRKHVTDRTIQQRQSCASSFGEIKLSKASTAL